MRGLAGGFLIGVKLRAIVNTLNERLIYFIVEVKVTI